MTSDASSQDPDETPTDGGDQEQNDTQSGEIDSFDLDRSGSDMPVPVVLALISAETEALLERLLGDLELPIQRVDDAAALQRDVVHVLGRGDTGVAGAVGDGVLDLGLVAGPVRPVLRYAIADHRVQHACAHTHTHTHTQAHAQAHM